MAANSGFINVETVVNNVEKEFEKGETSSQAAKSVEDNSVAKLKAPPDDKDELELLKQSPFYTGGFFKKLEDGTAKCENCSDKLIKIKDGNTAGLDSHLSRKHPKVYENYLKIKAEVEQKRVEVKEQRISRKRRAGQIQQDVLKTKQMKLDMKGGNLSLERMQHDPQVQKEWDDTLVDFITDTGASFSQVSGKPMEKLVNVLNKRSRIKVKVRSRFTLAKKVSSKAEQVLKEVSAIIKACQQDMESVSFTSDIWTSGAMDAYISLTVHTIDKDWILHRWTPFVKHFPDRHTGVLIKVKIDSMIEDLGLNTEPEDKFVVNDNARNAVLAIKLSPSLRQVLCGNHTLQLAINDCLNKLSVAGSEMTTVLSKGRVLSNSVKKSGPMTMELKEACKDKGIKYTTMKNPNDTRWNSREANLRSIVKLKPALVQLANDDVSGKWSQSVFSPAEWKLAEAAVKVLEIPMFVTKQWEAEKTPTMNLMVSEIYGMNKKLEKFVKSPCSFISEFASALKEEIEERFPNCGADDQIYAFGNYLDPSFKGVHLEVLNVLDKTKSQIRAKWKHLDSEGGVDEQAGEEQEHNMSGEESEELDPTSALLKARKAAIGDVTRKSQLKEEMDVYEGKTGTYQLEELPTNGDRLLWWKKHQSVLPTLAKIAKSILGIPCSSSKSERVFSTGGQIVTKKRHSLKAERVEHLVVLKENRSMVENFLKNTSYKVEVGENAFKKVDLERDKSLVPIPSASQVFNESDYEEVVSDTSEDGSDGEESD